ncbi:unnamed protein product [Allacma fusca]|uniref:Integrase catalytic domain-containing protein n=1 Tax=Allacma fusca TaxID=39272 RepID=A0A8J2PDP7_9HEXA|nr:unnamed protein product [Allacma fusca]
MIAAFTSIFKEAKVKPLYLFSDRGLEFRSAKFRAFLISHEIKLYHIYSHIKSSFAENFIRLLFTKLQRYMTEHNTKKISDVLQEFTMAYNNGYNNAIGMPPNAVKKEDQYKIWEKLYRKHLDAVNKPRSTLKFKINDLVRISCTKLMFEKARIELNQPTYNNMNLASSSADLKSFYAVLSSAANAHGSGGSGVIANSLPTPLQLTRGFYDVGLMKLRYTLHEYIAAESQTVAKAVKLVPKIISDKDPLFPGYQPIEIVPFKALVSIENKYNNLNEHILFSDNLADLFGFTQKNFYLGSFAASQLTLTDVFKDFEVNTEFRVNLIKYLYKGNLISIDQQITAIYIEMTPGETNLKKYFAAVSERIKLAGFNCLGFVQTRFSMGSYTSLAPFNEKCFKSIPKYDLLYFQLGYIDKIYLPMIEPKSLNVIDVIKEVNLALQEMNLPPVVKKYFGFEIASRFESETRMKIRKELVAEEEHEIFLEEEADEIVEIAAKPKRILITSNVVENQFYNNHHVILLAETNINFTNKAEVEANALRDELWYPNDVPEKFTSADQGLKKRFELSQKSKQFTMLGKLCCNIFNQPRWFPSGTEIRIILKRLPPEFCLNSAVETLEPFSGCPYRVELNSAIFYSSRKTISQKILDMHRKKLASGDNCKYPMVDVDMRIFTVSKGLTSATNDGIVLGRIPKIIVIGVTNAAAFMGKLTKDPFNFQHYNLSEISCTWNGEQLQYRHVNYSFKTSNSAGKANELLQGTEISQNKNSSTSNLDAQFSETEPLQEVSSVASSNQYDLKAPSKDGNTEQGFICCCKKQNQDLHITLPEWTEVDINDGGIDTKSNNKRKTTMTLRSKMNRIGKGKRNLKLVKRSLKKQKCKSKRQSKARVQRRKSNSAKAKSYGFYKNGFRK